MIHLLVYASTAVHLYTDAELTELLATARRKNAEHQITGMLLYSAGSFVQVLEGPEAVVRARFARIASDPGHKYVQIILEDTVPARQFGEWSMGFPSAGRVDPVAHPGLNRFLQQRGELTGDEALGHDALDFLRSFRDQL